MPFATLGLPPVIVKGARAIGYVEPTPIQRKAIPIIMQGNDLIASAQTGTGKTAAYLLPALTRLLDGPRRLRALVLTATRELAAKVETGARDYSRFTDLRVVVLHNGAPIAQQEKQLRETGADLIVATPLRLLELHAREPFDFEDIEILVLDESDRMVEMGFAADLRRILKLLPETRQTLMFTGTMPPELNRIAKEALVEPIRIDIGGGTKPAPGLTQAIYPVPKDLKTDLLVEMMSRQDVHSMIVFTRTREVADRLARQLAKVGYAVDALHSKLSQNERDRALNDLRRGKLQIVVATDNAGRAVDLDGISHVVNYDVPPIPEDYVRRIRREGPGGGTGDAFTLMAPEEQKEVAAIERFLGRSVARVMLPDFDYRMRPAEIQMAVSYRDGSRAEPAPPSRAAAARPAAGRPVTPPAAPRPQAAKAVAPKPPAGRPGPPATRPPAAKTGMAKPAGAAVATTGKPEAKPAPAKPAPAKPGRHVTPKPAAKKPGKH